MYRSVKRDDRRAFRRSHVPRTTPLPTYAIRNIAGRIGYRARDIKRFDEASALTLGRGLTDRVAS